MKFVWQFTVLTMIVFSIEAWSKTRVAVSKFTDKSGTGRCRVSWFSGNDLGTGMVDQLTTELSDQGRYDIQERENLHQMYKEEHQLINSDASSLPKKNQFKAAHYSITGAITSFEMCGDGLAGKVDVGGLIGFRNSGLNVGGKHTSAKVVIDLRVVDVEKGEVVKSVHAEGKASSTGFDVDGDYHGAKMGTSAFDSTPIGEATRKAIQSAARQLSAVIPDRKDTSNVASAAEGAASEAAAASGSGHKSSGALPVEANVKIAVGASNVKSSTVCMNGSNKGYFTMCKPLQVTAAGRYQVLYLDKGQEAILSKEQVKTLVSVANVKLGQTVYLTCGSVWCDWGIAKSVTPCKVIDLTDSIASVICTNNGREYSVKANALLGLTQYSNSRKAASVDESTVDQ